MLVVEGVNARGAALCEVEADDGDEHEEAAELGEEKEFNGRSEAVLMAPEVDEKIHRHEHELPGKIEEEEVEAQKDAEDARDGPGEAEVKKTGSVSDLAPGGCDRHAAEEGGQTDEDEARPIEAQMEADAGKQDPRGVKRDEPRTGRPGEPHEAEPQGRGKQKIDGEADERDPPGQFRAEKFGEPRSDPSADRDEEYGRQYHRNTAMAIKTAPPIATPMTYHLTLPDWVATSARDPRPVVQASPRKKRSTKSALLIRVIHKKGSTSRAR